MIDLVRGIVSQPRLSDSVPVRHMHSPVEMIDIRDLEELYRLILCIIRSSKQESCAVVHIDGGG